MADLIENCRRHRVMIGLLTVLGALLLGVRAQQQEFRLVGSDVTLVPNKTGDLKEITWAMNDILLVEFVLKPKEKFIYPLTNDRTTINKTNGALTIRYLTTGDSGLYKAQMIVDDSIQVTKIRLTVHDCPDQPTISVQSTKDWFVVSCKSFSTDVTYEWFNPTTSVSKSRLYTEPKKSGTLTCVVDNKVCNKSSSINFYISDQTEEKSVGGNVTLVPKYTGDPSEIIWKVNGDKLVEMVLKPRVDRIFYRLQDRATISDTDGSLTIRGLTMEDSGVYTAVVLVNNDYYYTEIRLPALKSRGLPGWIIALIVILVLAVIAIILFLLQYYCYKKNIKRRERLILEMKNSTSQVADVKREEESEKCITVEFRNDYTSPSDESRGLLENRLLTLCNMEAGEDVRFTAEVVFDKKKGDGTENKEKESDTETPVKELVWKKDGVTQFKWANSSLKFLTSNIKLKPKSVTVNDAEGKKSYKVTVYDAEGKKSYRVKFRLEEPPESMSICSITFHPIKMTGIDRNTWEKGSQKVNTKGDRITCDPNGDLTIYDATSEDKGTYTVQCKDKKQEFILHL